MTATYGCWQVPPNRCHFFSGLLRRLSLTALVFDDCMENDTWVMWDRHRTGESKGGFDLRNPKPETRNGQLKLASIDKTRNPKPETESWFQATKPETRNRRCTIWGPYLQISVFVNGVQGLKDYCTCRTSGWIKIIHNSDIRAWIIRYIHIIRKR